MIHSRWQSIGTWDGYITWERASTIERFEQYLATLEMDSSFGSTRWHLGLAYQQKAMYEKAIIELKRALTLGGDKKRIMVELGHAYAVSGRRQEAENTAR